MSDRTLELYLHIPFCVRKCAYCDFLSAPADDAVREAYTEALCREIRESAEEGSGRTVTTLFLGGGTPSILTSRQLSEILMTARRSFSFAEDAEVTIEANPGTVTEEKLCTLKEAGVNRLSFGLQSADDEELRMLGRIHTWKDFLDSYTLARDCGFGNINVDLMAALPGQTEERFLQSLAEVCALSPEHLSVYSLIIEEGTPFAEGLDARGRSLPPLPSEETERLLYEETKNILEKQNYFRYEISNYAKPGKSCRHNIGYWTGVPYLGLGLGAASCLNGVRTAGTSSLKTYLAGNPAREVTERIGEKEGMEEFCFLGMRMMCGISEAEFAERFHKKIDAVYGDVIDSYVSDGFLIRKDGRIALSEAGISVSNRILASFLLDD